MGPEPAIPCSEGASSSQDYAHDTTRDGVLQRSTWGETPYDVTPHDVVDSTIDDRNPEKFAAHWLAQRRKDASDVQQLVSAEGKSGTRENADQESPNASAHTLGMLYFLHYFLPATIISNLPS